MRRGSLNAALTGAAVMLALALVVGVVALYAGVYNVAATSEHGSAIRWLLKTGQRRSVGARAARLPEPPALDSAALASGVVHFDAMCVQCHGAPGVEPSEVGVGMNPTPPDLVEAAEEWNARELFWITKNGIRLAGMPAFGPTHSDEELWAIVELVRHLPRIDSASYRSRVAALRGAPDSSSAAPASHGHAPGTPAHAH